MNIILHPFSFGGENTHGSDSIHLFIGVFFDKIKNITVSRKSPGSDFNINERGFGQRISGRTKEFRRNGIYDKKTVQGCDSIHD